MDDIIDDRDICVPATGKMYSKGGSGLRSHITIKSDGDSLHLAIKHYLENVFSKEHVTILNEHIASNIKNYEKSANGTNNNKVSTSAASQNNNQNDSWSSVNTSTWEIVIIKSVIKKELFLVVEGAMC